MTAASGGGGPESWSPPDAPGEVASPIGWARAILEALTIFVVGVVLLAIGPNWALTRLTGLSRNARVTIASAGFLTMFVALAWALRRLQARRVI